jgi:hypothetical protein
VRISAFERESQSPHAGGGYSDVFLGKFNDRKVIVKVLKVYSGDDLATKERRIKVGFSDYSMVARGR